MNLARTAIALERYRLAHGEFPESLDALAPQFIAQVPPDVIGSTSQGYGVASPPSQGYGAASPPLQGSGAASQPLKYHRDWRRTSFSSIPLVGMRLDDNGVVVFKATRPAERHRVPNGHRPGRLGVEIPRKVIYDLRYTIYARA